MPEANCQIWWFGVGKYFHHLIMIPSFGVQSDPPQRWASLRNCKKSVSVPGNLMKEKKIILLFVFICWGFWLQWNVASYCEGKRWEWRAAWAGRRFTRVHTHLQECERSISWYLTTKVRVWCLSSYVAWKCFTEYIRATFGGHEDSCFQHENQ